MMLPLEQGQRIDRGADPAEAGRHPVRAQRRRVRARHVPRPRRHRRGLSVLRGAGRPDRAVRRRDRRTRRLRPADRPTSWRHERLAIYPEVALRHAARANSAGHRVDQGRAGGARGRALEAEGKLLEAQRLHQRTMFDLEMIREIGLLPRHRELLAAPDGPGARRAASDAARLPSRRLAAVRRREPRRPCRRFAGCITATGRASRCWSTTASACRRRSTTARCNFDEWQARTHQVIFVSATPGPYELREAGGVVVEQIIRPTGLIDPPIEIRPVEGPGGRPAGGDSRARGAPASACWSPR